MTARSRIFSVVSVFSGFDTETTVVSVFSRSGKTVKTLIPRSKAKKTVKTVKTLLLAVIGTALVFFERHIYVNKCLQCLLELQSEGTVQQAIIPRVL